MAGHRDVIPASTARDPRVVRAATLLRDAERRREEGAVALDGDELIGAALDAGLAVEYVLVDPARSPSERWSGRVEHVVPAAPDALRALAALGQPPAAVAVARLPEPAPLAPLPARSLVLSGVADAGNVGSIARTAAAFELPRVVLAGAADPWSRRALRAAQGASLRPGLLAFAPGLAAVAALAERPPLAAAVPRGGAPPDALPAPVAVVLGAEGDGLDAADLARCELRVTIPAPGFESLNVSAAAAILAWELA